MPVRFNHRTLPPRAVLKTREDYVHFMNSFDSYVGAAGVQNIWDGTRARPDNDQDAADYDSDHGNLLYVIKERLDRTVQTHMSNDGVPQTVSAVKAWLLANYSTNTSSENQKLIERKMESLELSGFNSFDDYHSALQQLRSDYLEAGGRINEDRLKELVLDGVECKYEVEARTLRSLGNLRTFAEVTESIKKKELKDSLNSKDDRKRAVDVNASDTEKSCYCCLHPAHFAQDCPFRKGRGMWCLHCFKNKHWSKDCKNPTVKQHVLCLDAVEDDEDQDFYIDHEDEVDVSEVRYRY